MKDVVEAIKFLSGEHNPWIIGVMVLVVLLFMYKVIKENLTLSYGMTEKKLSSLLKYVDAGITRQPHFSVEQVFHQNYRLLLSFDEIQYLLSVDAPSRAVRDYVWGNSFLRFDPHSKSVTLRKPVRFGLNKLLILALLVISFVFALMALVVFLAAVASVSPIEYLPKSAIVLGYATFSGWFFFRETRALVAAENFIKTEAQRVISHSTGAVASGEPAI